MRDMDNRHKDAQQELDPQRDGSLDERYQLYRDLTFDNPPKTYDEWLES